MLAELMPKIKSVYDKQIRIKQEQRQSMLRARAVRKVKIKKTKLENNKHLQHTDKKSFENSEVQGIRPARLADAEYNIPAFVIKSPLKQGSGFMNDKGNVKI